MTNHADLPKGTTLVDSVGTRWIIICLPGIFSKTHATMIRERDEETVQARSIVEGRTDRSLYTRQVRLYSDGFYRHDKSETPWTLG